MRTQRRSIVHTGTASRRVKVVATLITISLLLGSIAVPAASASRQSRGNVSLVSSQTGLTRLYYAFQSSLASFGDWLVNKSETPKRTPYVPVAAFISPAPFFINAPTNLTVTATASNSVSLSWTAPSGVVAQYRVERSTSIFGPFVLVATPTSTTYTDNGVSNGTAYLYRVRAIDGGGSVSAASNMALGTAVSFAAGVLQGQVIKAQHVNEVRTAVNAVRTVANLTPATWARTALTGLIVQANDIQELRNKLGEALSALNINVAVYTDATLSTGTNGTFIKAVHLEELQTRATRGRSNSFGPPDSDISTARLDPLNETGGGDENPLSRNFNWSLPLVSLPGRAGMDLGLTLSYNSLVWTKSGNSISFDLDKGFPGPGFRLGFPVIQPLYFNPEVGKFAFLMISPDGSKTELRQVGTSSLYEAADSSYLLLDSVTMVLRTADGTQLTYVQMGNEFNCTQIKDRNGNYLTINYTASGRVDTVIDTLERQIKFNYDTSGWLTSITQVWNQGSPSQVIHNWARFTYTNSTIQTNFTGLTVNGPANGSTLKTLAKVTLADGSHYDFSYTSWGQVWKVSSFAADNHLLNHRSYNLPQTASVAHTDCPRFTERRDWAQFWNGDTDGTVASGEEAITTFAVPTSDSWTTPSGAPQTGMRSQVTQPDGTSDKIYFAGTAQENGWHRGLPALVNTYDNGGVLRRQVETTWIQNTTSVSYPLNPRVIETNVFDPAGNRARTRTDYQPFNLGNGMSCQLPVDVLEYAADATTVLRRTRTLYNLNSAYTTRRIIGLVSERLLYESGVISSATLIARVAFNYDESGSIQGTDAPVQHDDNDLTGTPVIARGNLSSVKRYDVIDTLQFTTSSMKYNTAGAMVFAKDAANNEVRISYADAFSDGQLRNTLAYVTTVTDPDLNSTTTKYSFDLGVVTLVQTPKPNSLTYEPGPQQIFTYDALGRLERVSNSVNGAYTRFEYPASQIRVDTYKTVQQGLAEAHSFKITDGLSRVIAAAKVHPDSVGGFSGQRLIYDKMGRVIKTSNPTETSAVGSPFSWVTAGDDASAGWIYVEQTYDWKDRPLVTTNPSITSNPAETTSKQISYSGCGCAGGEVSTITDEVGRVQKIYKDVLGRAFKVEILNPDSTTYATTVKSFNPRDQVTRLRQYAGPEGSATFQDTTMTYDGFGRLRTEHLPQQDDDTETSWNYNPDDTISSVTDARGATQTFSYNKRGLQTRISYSAPSGIKVPLPVNFTYDAAGNRVSMIDGLGSKTYQYSSLSELIQETRQFTVGTYSVNYTYNLGGQLQSITDPFGASFFYSRDAEGNLKTLTGSPYGGVTEYIKDIKYRAWGAPKSVSYNGSSSTTSYNARLLPSEFRLLATSGTSMIRENYSYFNDGRPALLRDLDDTGGPDPPATLRFLSRAYTYDHLGRITSGVGAGSAGNGVPFRQSYGYDQFGNMTGRGGAYYNYNFMPFTSSGDNSTYTNNRRNGWTHDAEGQVTESPASATDDPRSVTYDAAGRMVSTIQRGSTTTINFSVEYDGDDQVVYESNTTSPGSSESSYILRSTVLEGAILTRLDQSGNKKSTHVPAEGLLFAVQTSVPSVFQVHRNPLGTTETSQRVYDPLGHLIPFQRPSDPRPPAGSFTSATMRGLSASLQNPHSLGTGCLVDGLPMDCDQAMRLLANGAAMRCPQNDCGPRRSAYWDEDKEKFEPVITSEFRAWGDGTYFFLPYGTSYADFYEWINAGMSDNSTGYGALADALAMHFQNPSTKKSQVTKRRSTATHGPIRLTPSGGGRTRRTLNEAFDERLKPKRLEKLDHIIKKMPYDPRYSFIACMETEMAPQMRVVRGILYGTVVTVGGDSLPSAVSPLGQVKRIKNLAAARVALQAYNPTFEEARLKAIPKCRTQSGYTGPLPKAGE